jgi:hypothetical protein
MYKKISTELFPYEGDTKFATETGRLAARVLQSVHGHGFQASHGGWEFVFVIDNQ